jgi:pyridoxal phosphate enzyme (YggS family)
MNSIDRLNEIRTRIPANVKIVAVSKTKPVEMIDLLYRETGQRFFGENKVQELEAKYRILPGDIVWHFIGHLQTNKIKYITPYIGLIQSVDSFRLLREINKEAIKCNRVIPCLLQFYIANEEAKFGFSVEEAIQMLNDNSFRELTNVSFKGVMGMATFIKDEQQIRKEFKQLYSYFNKIKSEYFAHDPDFCEISMGMTNDYQLAIEEGSTIVRIGSGIFGER